MNKPCPFCGGTKTSVMVGETFRWRYVNCDTCSARSGDVRMQTAGEGTREQWEAKAAADAYVEWNTRAAEFLDRVNAREQDSGPTGD